LPALIEKDHGLLSFAVGKKCEICGDKRSSIRFAGRISDGEPY